ncbi:MAG: electron transfer flavoprotein-ubiquinone oxidoreductase [Oxalobacter formigenes]|nr:electron transfer flavoprotein-ubiquinone oxidoreductase [Oxalobacter formigenes]
MKMSEAEQQEAMAYDVVIAGAGPAGLAAAIRLKQLALEKGRDCSVCVLEKGSEPGAHIISGAVMDPVAMDELLPSWREKDACPGAPVLEEKFLFLGENQVFQMPDVLLPRALKNKGCYLVSLSRLVRWLAGQAESLGVDVFAGFAAAEILYGGQGMEAVTGVATGPAGLGKNGEKTPVYQPGMAVKAAYTLFAEGARGHLGKALVSRFSLDAERDPQSYTLALKEVWRVPESVHRPGLAVHTAGWPLGRQTYGGGFVYHLPDCRVALGLMTGLGYANPYLSPYQEFQRFKAHPAIARILQGGECLEYGARAMAAGGLQALPGLVFPGGALLGCDAGFMNGARLKGIHTAIKSGMLAAEAVFGALEAGRCHDVPNAYPRLFRQSWLYDELYRARNFKPAMRFGLVPGAALFGLDQMLFKGHAPWTLHRSQPDDACLKKAASCMPFSYDAGAAAARQAVLSSLYFSGTHHREDQPSHLLLKDEEVPVAINLADYAGPEARYCPAAVYEFATDAAGLPRLCIHAANCLHCKTCDIKDPSQNIDWVPPEGGDGPEYREM